MPRDCVILLKSLPADAQPDLRQYGKRFNYLLVSKTLLWPLGRFTRLQRAEALHKLLGKDVTTIVEMRR